MTRFHLRYLVPILEQTWVFSTCINVLQPMILQIYFRHQWLRKLFLTDPVILPHVLSSSLTSLCGEGGTRLHIVIKKQELWIYTVVPVCFVLCSLFSSQSYLTVYCLFGSYWALKWYSCRTVIAPWSLSSTVIVSLATATVYIKLGYYFFFPCVWLFIYLHCIWFCYYITLMAVRIFYSSVLYYFWQQTLLTNYVLVFSR